MKTNPMTPYYQNPSSFGDRMSHGNRHTPEKHYPNSKSGKTKSNTVHKLCVIIKINTIKYHKTI